MNKTKNNKKKIGLLILSIIILVGIIIGITYAYILYQAKQNDSSVINSDCINVTFDDVTHSIDLEEAYPLSDWQGLNTTPYTFKITNTCSTLVNYHVVLDVMGTDKRIASDYIAIKFNNDDKTILSKYNELSLTEEDTDVAERRELITGALLGGESISYDLRLWLDKSASNDTQKSTFEAKIVVDAYQQLAVYYEDILNGTDPVISGDLIPVEIADDGTVTKADIYEEWYSYENKVWANAVILKDDKTTYNDGDAIPEDNIESYFVWIPKYSYEIWNLGTYTTYSGTSLPSTSNAKSINIKFGTENTSDDNEGECTTPMTSGATGNCTIGDYMTSPAFINAGTTGLWIGKFEVGYNGATSTSTAQVSTISSESVIVKPNVYSWRYNNVYNFFMSLYNYNRDLDSHMMKNTEWGAVAYLSHSKYGINREVWINNNSNYVTGCVGASASASSVSECTNTYNSTTGFNGSTTGNISGIYDMSGGASEYMAAYRENTIGSSGFSTDELTLYADYLDVYNASSSINSYQYRILGDATGENGPFYYFKYNGWYSYFNNWYQDYSNFVESNYPWFNRGGDYGDLAGAGQFSFFRDTGEAVADYSTRLVLAI